MAPWNGPNKVRERESERERDWALRIEVENHFLTHPFMTASSGSQSLSARTMMSDTLPKSAGSHVSRSSCHSCTHAHDATYLLHPSTRVINAYKHGRKQAGRVAVPAREVEAVVRSPTNMAAAKIAAVDFSKMTSLDLPASAMFVGGKSASQSTASNASAVMIGRNNSLRLLSKKS